jgi:hypothetical protein
VVLVGETIIEMILRPFYDNDLVLVERWLEASHVKPWHEQPEDWLYEVSHKGLGQKMIA